MTPILHLFRLASSACGTSTGALPSLYDGLKCNANGDVTLTSVQDALVILANVLRILIAISGGVAVIVIIVAGIYFIISTGDPSRIKRARDIIQNAVVGLLVILTAYAVVTFIAKGF